MVQTVRYRCTFITEVLMVAVPSRRSITSNIGQQTIYRSFQERSTCMSKVSDISLSPRSPTSLLALIPALETSLVWTSPLPVLSNRTLGSPPCVKGSCRTRQTLVVSNRFQTISSLPTVANDGGSDVIIPMPLGLFLRTASRT